MSESPDAKFPGLYRKPLVEAAIGKLLTPYRPGAAKGTTEQEDGKVTLLCWPFQWPWQCTGTILRASLTRNHWTPSSGKHLLRYHRVFFSVNTFKTVTKQKDGPYKQ
jgi:hypothetical protein